ncbi:MAG: type 4a pilus biogenesis protein PilO [Planctomycetota bacterium]
MRFGIREIIFVAILLAVPAGWYMALAQPRLKDRLARQDEIVSREKQIQQVAKATENVPDVEAEIQKLQNAIAHFQNQLPNDREVETLLPEIWNLAGEHGLSAKSVRPEKSVPAAEYEELPIKIEIVGDFDGFYEFIQDIEKLPRITRMPRIKIEKLKQSNDAGVVKANLTLSIFYEGGRA